MDADHDLVKALERWVEQGSLRTGSAFGPRVVRHPQHHMPSDLIFIFAPPPIRLDYAF